MLDLLLNEKPKDPDIVSLPLLELACPEEEAHHLLLFSHIPQEAREAVSGEKVEVFYAILDDQNSVVDSEQGILNFTDLPENPLYPYAIFSLPSATYTCRFILRNLETGKSARGSVKVKLTQPSKIGLVSYPSLLLVSHSNPLYLKGQKKGQEDSFSLSDFYPFDQNKYVPLIGNLKKAVDSLTAFLRYSYPRISAPDIDLSFDLVQESTGQFVNIEPRVEKGIHEGTQIFQLHFQTSGLEPGRYILCFGAKEKTTHSESFSQVSFKVE
jgi:hypothetical protein